MGHLTLFSLVILIIVININVECRGLNKEGGKTKGKNSLPPSLRKLKKQLKREIRTKLLPKALKNIGKSLESLVTRKVDEALRREENDKGSSTDDILAMFNHVQSRMKILEEENDLLRKSLKSNSKKFEGEFEQLQHFLSQNCNCRKIFTATTSPPATTSSAFRVPEVFAENIHPRPPSSEYSFNRNISVAGESRKMSVVTLKEDLTFNLSADMPQFTGEDSLLAVDDDGLMTRISLTNSSVRGTMVTESFVEGITYDPVSRKIFWGSNRASRKAVHSVGLDGSHLRKIQDGKWAFSLAVDGRRRKLFISEWSTKEVCVMSTNGQNYKLVTDYSADGDPRNIVLDTQRRLLYVSYSFSVVKMKYDGTRIKRLAEGIWMQPLSIDVVTNTLYYSIKKNIYKLNFSEGVSKFVNQMDLDMSTIVFLKNKLYIAYQSWVPPIDVLDLKTNALTRFADVRSDSLLRLCIIPALE